MKYRNVLFYHISITNLNELTLQTNSFVYFFHTGFDTAMRKMKHKWTKQLCSCRSWATLGALLPKLFSAQKLVALATETWVEIWLISFNKHGYQCSQLCKAWKSFGASRNSTLNPTLHYFSQITCSVHSIELNNAENKP